MTNEEIITQLQDIKCHCQEMYEAEIKNVDTSSSIWGKDVEALAMAIKALESQMWIPVSERLPEKPYGCIVTVMDTNPMTCDEFENIYPDFVGWDGENWNDADGDSIPFEVIAWMPLPKPYTESEDEE